VKLFSLMTRFPIVAVLFLVLASATSIRAEDFAQKIRDISPDGQFAMLLSYDEELNKEFMGSDMDTPDRIAPEAMKQVDIVTLPWKKIVTTLRDVQALDGNTNIALIWSPDSKWFAFYSGQTRTGDTEVYRRSGDEFVLALQTDDAQLKSEKGLKGAVVKNDYVRPIRWTKPGVLLLKHHMIFRGDKGDATFELTAGVDPKSGKFLILAKKRMHSKTESN
jgi:hypothetical protein